MFGVLMVVGGLLAFLIPETNNAPLPKTAAEANRMKWNWNSRSVLFNESNPAPSLVHDVINSSATASGSSYKKN